MLEFLKEIIIATYGSLKFWYQVDHWEQAVLLKWGKYNKTLSPGRYWKWPIRDYGLSTNVKPDTVEIDAISITTLDRKTISIGIMVPFQVKDVKLFLVEHNDSLSNFVDICKGELSDLIEDTTWDDIRKKSTRTILKNKIKPHAEALGLQIGDVKFTEKCEVRSFKIFTANNKITSKPTLI
jgi:modulator of FtsH protease HflK